jgi:hypothetical protein
MRVRFIQADKRTAVNGLTLVEVLMSLAVFTLMVGGLITGYIQCNRLAQWSAMSFAAESIASQGAEQALCAKWVSQLNSTTNTGPGTSDELPPGTYVNGLGNNQHQDANYTLDIPGTGAPIQVTNVVVIANAYTAGQPPVRQITSTCTWEFTPGQTSTNHVYYVNTVVMMRAPDQ